MGAKSFFSCHKNQPFILDVGGVARTDPTCNNMYRVFQIMKLALISNVNPSMITYISFCQFGSLQIKSSDSLEIYHLFWNTLYDISCSSSCKNHIMTVALLAYQ
jgi:hypothetical protein